MTAKILDGKRLAVEIQAELAERVAAFQARTGIQPALATVLVGEDPASQVYIRSKLRACQRVGMISRHIPLSAQTTQSALLQQVQSLNADPTIHGILVQLPLPAGLDSQGILDAIDPGKDVDAFHAENVGRLVQGRPRFLPCTPHGVMQILARYGLQVAGRHAVVLGRSDIVGKPMALLLAARNSPWGPDLANATVTLCHSRTPDLPAVIRQADVLIAAIGQPEFVRGSMVKPGAVVIDVGINRIDEPKHLVGDVAYEEVADVAAAITPVPGGVGPLTVTMLMENTLAAAELAANKANKP